MSPLGLLIALPTGLSQGGVQTWAVRLASAWASYDTPAAIIAHGADEAVHFRGGAQLASRWPLVAELSREVALLAGPELPTLTTASEPDLARMLPAYCAAIEGVLAASERVLVVPTLLGDCYGLCVAAQRVLHARAAEAGNKGLSDRVRIAGWLHSAFPYDSSVLSHYEPALDAIACVSEHLTTCVHTALPHRQSTTLHVPNGVLSVPDEEMPGPDDARSEGSRQASVRQDSSQHTQLKLIYVGRLDDDVKRVGVLPLLSEQLAQRGIAHHITIVGEGPALASLRARATPHMSLVGTKASDEVRELLLHHDALVLPSRSEGLSLSMLEAMGAGCCPVVTRTPSGASEALSDGSTGVLVDAAHLPDHESVAIAFAEALAHVPRSQLAAMGERARRACASRYSVSRQLAGVRALANKAFAQPQRVWSHERFAFSAKPSTGPNAEARLRQLLAQHPTARLLVHGTGKHTRELAHIWTDVLPQIEAFVEDDHTRAGERLLGKPIITPEAAGTTGATHVVISSHLNQQDIWNRRAVYERQGIEVLRMYG
jgi:glycosyltransferase involved in cell wall biosynthesis